MSLGTDNSLMETVHLMRSPADAAHLARSLLHGWCPMWNWWPMAI
ncbi:hypothetical protein SynRS9909_01052 [Synechococcus sp. RS9909]|nr:hypothetical protein SynRS9909_01052 [Synechococcus sp. RS9909]